MKITLKKHPELKLANKLIKKFPGAIIAGGVARDLINGKEFKQVDIFIPASTVAKLTKISFDLGCFATELNEESSIHDINFMANSQACFGIANLDICIAHKHFDNAESLVSTFNMVSSQAWLEPTKDGFEVKATDFFHELNNKKILGFYEGVSLGSDHIVRIIEKYPDYLKLSLVQPASSDDGFSDIPF